ncbi:hypothetical protein J5X84_06270 [Streptosporangiaceae bacterium NEAU-GS5]|nr:hypothetical protein [Streptosporangiaceae bacterium NEAU-GS5]
MDERARTFSAAELRVACFLAAEGREIVAVGSGPVRPDALVDGHPTDFVVLDPHGTSVAVTMALSRAARHAEHAVIDARGSGVSLAAADAGVRRFRQIPHGARLRDLRVIGDGYDVTYPSALRTE